MISLLLVWLRWSTNAMVRHFEGIGRVYNKLAQAETPDHAHGRDEICRVSVGHAIEEIASADRWPNLATLIHIEFIRTVKDVTSTELRYYISSRRKLAPRQALTAVRSHWGIENELHWVRDVAFRKDGSRVRAGNGAANFSAIRQLALGLLKKRTEHKSGIKARRARCWLEPEASPHSWSFASASNRRISARNRCSRSICS